MTVVDSDMQQLTADQQRLVTDDCSTSEPSNALVCQDDEAAVVADQSQLRNDEARAESDKTSGQLSNSQAEAGVTSATTDLQTAQDQLTNLTLTAPIAGTVLQVNGQIGQTVSGTSTGSSTLPGTTAPIPAVAGSGGTQGKQPFILIGNTIAFIVGAAFPATDIPELAPGQSGTITDVSLHGLSLPCHVFAVAQATVMLNGASVVYATLMPVGFPKGLYSGQEVSVSIAVSQATRVLAVPQSAVFLESGIPHVDVWRDHRSVATVVGTGLEGRSLIQITSGLSRGQQVVLSAYQGLSEGATPVVGSQ
jgi:macrolide-specific efflux system membrane fusion protein